MNFCILTDNLLQDYKQALKTPPTENVGKENRAEISVDYFQFYKSSSSVYSSKIEGEDIDFDSYFKHKFLNVKFQPDYTRKADDLYAAYDFIDSHPLTLENMKKAHAVLSRNLLPKSHQGRIRTNPMFVLNTDDRIEYIAADPKIVESELDKLFSDIELLLESELNPFETFYYAAFIHLVFVKIHPFQDGNGRTARLIEKWFLLEKIGQEAHSILSEKNYYKNIRAYYANIQKIGVEYDVLDYSKSLPFLLMTAKSV